jgi:hypothetical protein
LTPVPIDMEAAPVLAAAERWRIVLKLSAYSRQNL